MRPGPAPLTGTERAAIAARSVFDVTQRAFEKWRTWSDGTTHAIHESQTLRIEYVHEAHPRDTAWTIAAYETPVSDRMWHLTATGTTLAPVLQDLLIHLRRRNPRLRVLARETRPMAVLLGRHGDHQGDPRTRTANPSLSLDPSRRDRWRSP